MKYQDIQISDVSLQQAFVKKWLRGDYAEALSILSNPKLNSKKFNALICSALIQSLLALENYYQTNFPNALAFKLTEYNKSINNFIYKKDWDSSVSYVIGNFVLYQGNIYACIKNNLNIVPTDNEYWLSLNLIGKDGTYGIDGTIRFDWNSIISYKQKDIVYYNNFLWYAQNDNTNEIPQEGSVVWVKFLKLPQTKIVVSYNPPVQPKNDVIWIHILGQPPIPPI